MSSAVEIEPRILLRSQHSISRSLIHRDALKVLYRLNEAGHTAYLVGGSVRDLLLGRQPKDFDVATSARPNEVRRLFRNARIIGRRFRLAHVLFKDHIVEVSTFRRVPAPEQQDGESPDDLLITSDNTFGTPREDAFRRDFTVNALFYNIADFTVLDYVEGIADLEHRLIRAIGDPDVRFREDPVRMLRACELAGRLGLGIESATQEAIHRQRRELERAAPARLTEELVQLVRCGHAGAALQWMLELGLLEVYLPEAYAMVAADERGLGEFGRVLPVVDSLVAAGREPSDGAVLAALLLPSVLLRRLDVEALDQRPLGAAAREALVDEMIQPFLQRTTLPKLKAIQVAQALYAFLALCTPGRDLAGRLRVARRPGFDDGLLLFEILVEATGEGAEELVRWREVAARRGEPALERGPEVTVAEVPRARHRRPRKRRRRRSGTRTGDS